MCLIILLSALHWSWFPRNSCPNVYPSVVKTLGYSPRRPFLTISLYSISGPEDYDIDSQAGFLRVEAWEIDYIGTKGVVDRYGFLLGRPERTFVLIIILH